jgi:hypothetical protein
MSNPHEDMMSHRFSYPFVREIPRETGPALAMADGPPLPMPVEVPTLGDAAELSGTAPPLETDDAAEGAAVRGR